MNWTELIMRVSLLQEKVSAWYPTHHVEADLIAVGGILGSLALILKIRSMRKHLRWRILWGRWMNRTDREAFEKSIVSLALVDGIEDAIARGDMTVERATWWYHSFANNYKMELELLPKKDSNSIKKSIRRRLNAGFYRVKSILPGMDYRPFSWDNITGKDKHRSIDPTYKPAEVVAVAGLKKSKYAT